MYGKEAINYKTCMQSLSIQDQLEIWSWILGKLVSLNQFITSPFRSDTHPFCKLREYNGVVLFTDFAFPEYNKYTCLHAIDFFRKKGLNEAAMFVTVNLYYDVRPIITSHIVQSGITLRGRPSKTELHFIPFTDENGEACFVQHDYEYWLGTGVTVQDLQANGVYSVKYFYINNKRFNPKYPCYAYIMPSGKIKIYQPFGSKINKWFSNTSKNDIWEFEGNNTLLITKSFKDAIILSKILDYTIHAYQNEGVIPDIDYSKYDEVIVLYDHDKAGIRSSEKLLEQINNSNKKIIFFECEEKDAYEIVKAKSIRQLKRELKKIL